jgi:hypothetical protein
MKNDIYNLIEESLSSPQDSRRDTRIVEILRGMDRFEAVEILKVMVEEGCPNTFHIAKKVLGSRKVAEPFFIFGLKRADASSIGAWLEFAIPRIGLRRVIGNLKKQQAENPKIINMALYWLPSLIDEKDSKLIEDLKREDDKDTFL